MEKSAFYPMLTPLTTSRVLQARSVVFSRSLSGVNQCIGKSDVFFGSSKVEAGRPQSNWTDQQIDRYLVANREKYDPKIDPQRLKKALDEVGQTARKEVKKTKDKNKNASIFDGIWNLFDSAKKALLVTADTLMAERKAQHLLPKQVSVNVFNYKYSPRRLWDRIYTGVPWRKLGKELSSFKISAARDSWKEGARYVARRAVSLEGAASIKKMQSKLMRLMEQRPYIEAHDKFLTAKIQDKSSPWHKRLGYRLERRFLCRGPLEVLKTYGPILDRLPPFPFAGFAQDLEDVKAEYKKQTGHTIEQIDPDPIGTGSIAQVFKAKDSQGTELAIKVLRPDANEETIDQYTDFYYMKTAVRLGWQGRVAAYRDALKQTELLKAELKLAREKTNADCLTKAVADLNRRNPAEPSALLTPKFFATTARANIQQFVAGKPLSQIENAAELQSLLLKIGPALIRLSPGLSPFVALDPHRGNFIGKNMVDQGRNLSLKAEVLPDFRNLMVALFLAHPASTPYALEGDSADVQPVVFPDENKTALRGYLKSLLVQPVSVTDSVLDEIIEKLKKPISIKQSDNGLLSSSGERFEENQTHLFNFWLRYTDVQEELKKTSTGPQLKPIVDLAISPEDRLQVVEKTRGLLYPSFIQSQPHLSDQAILTDLKDLKTAKAKYYQFEKDPQWKTDIERFFREISEKDELEAQKHEAKDKLDAIMGNEQAAYTRQMESILLKPSQARERFIQLIRVHLQVIALANTLTKDIQALNTTALQVVHNEKLATALTLQIRQSVGLDPVTVFKKQDEAREKSILSWIVDSMGWN